METIRDAIAIAEATPRVPKGTDGPPPSVPGPQPAPEPDLALQIRMTASSLAGIALIQRNPVSESTR